MLGVLKRKKEPQPKGVQIGAPQNFQQKSSVHALAEEPKYDSVDEQKADAAREVATSDAVTSPKPNPNLNPNELDAAREAATSDAVTKRLIHGPRLLGSAHPHPHPRPNPGDEAAHLAHGPAD